MNTLPKVSHQEENSNHSHQHLACHRAGLAYQLIVPQCQDVGKLMHNQLSKRMLSLMLKLKVRALF